MNNKKGFALAKAFGVIVIIGILLLIVAPTILNRLGSQKENISEITKRLMYNAANQYINEHRQNFKTGRKYCIKVETLIKDGKLISPVSDVTTGKTYDDASVKATILEGDNIFFELVSAGKKCTEDPGITIGELKCVDGKSQAQVIVSVGNGNRIIDSVFINGVQQEIKNRGLYDKNVQVDDGLVRVNANIKEELTGQIKQISKKSTPSKVTIQYNTNGGTIENIAKYTKKIKGLKYGSLPTPKKEGYTFIGWYEDNTTFKKQVTKDTCVTGSKTLYAKYKINPPTCKLSLNGKINNGWYTSDVTISMEIEGEATKYGISKTKKSTNKKKSVTHKGDGKSITYYGYVSNSSGSNACQITFKKDSKPPVITRDSIRCTRCRMNKDVNPICNMDIRLGVLVLDINYEDSESGISYVYSTSDDGETTTKITVDGTKCLISSTSKNPKDSYTNRKCNVGQMIRSDKKTGTIRWGTATYNNQRDDKVYLLVRDAAGNEAKVNYTGREYVYGEYNDRCGYEWVK